MKLFYFAVLHARCAVALRRRKQHAIFDCLFAKVAIAFSMLAIVSKG